MLNPQNNAHTQHTRLLFSVDASLEKNILPTLSYYHENKLKIPQTDRAVGIAHQAFIRQILTLLHLDMERLRMEDTRAFIHAVKQNKSFPLSTNNVQLSKRCMTCTKSIWRYIEDFSQIRAPNEAPIITGKDVQSATKNYTLYINTIYLVQNWQEDPMANHDTDSQFLASSKTNLPLSNTNILNTQKHYEIVANDFYERNQPSGESPHKGARAGAGLTRAEQAAVLDFYWAKIDRYANIETKAEALDAVDFLWEQAANTLFPNQTMKKVSVESVFGAIFTRYDTIVQQIIANRSEWLNALRSKYYQEERGKKLNETDARAKAAARAQAFTETALYPSHFRNPYETALLICSDAIQAKANYLQKHENSFVNPTRYFITDDNGYPQALKIAIKQHNQQNLRETPNKMFLAQLRAKEAVNLRLVQVLRKYRTLHELPKDQKIPKILEHINNLREKLDADLQSYFAGLPKGKENYEKYAQIFKERLKLPRFGVEMLVK